jgi:hypothetical protein
MTERLFIMEMTMFAISGSLTRWLVRSGLALVVLAVVWGARPVERAYACSCMAPPPPAEARNGADAVFAGTVTGVLQNAPLGTSNNRVMVSFRVSEVWKGANNPEIAVLTSGDSASCGFGFDQGGQYLVYAFIEEGRLTTNLCSRTNALAQAGEDLAALGEGTTPPLAATGNPLGAVAPWIGIGAVALVAVGLVVVVVRRRR